MRFHGSRLRSFVAVALFTLSFSVPGAAQNRGVYPLGMTATNSGVTPGPGFTYINQLLFYSRDHFKDDAGNTLPVTGENYVLMDMNTLAWVSKKAFFGGARYSAAATLPFAKNSLTSDVAGKVSGGGGFPHPKSPSFLLPSDKGRGGIGAIHRLLAPRGRLPAPEDHHGGSGDWRHAPSSG